ncbi:MAG TPA: hypothetical protein VF880_09435 [Actinomycetes bacterium]|jgi:hypothetical protein
MRDSTRQTQDAAGIAGIRLRYGGFYGLARPPRRSWRCCAAGGCRCCAAPE